MTPEINHHPIPSKEAILAAAARAEKWPGGTSHYFLKKNGSPLYDDDEEWSRNGHPIPPIDQW